jgi:hypothetical protein
VNESEQKPDPQADQRYDEAAVTKMAALWALMYRELCKQGIPPEHATRLVETWISHTLVRQ